MIQNIAKRPISKYIKLFNPLIIKKNYFINQRNIYQHNFFFSNLKSNKRDSGFNQVAWNENILFCQQNSEGGGNNLTPNNPENNSPDPNEDNNDPNKNENKTEVSLTTESRSEEYFSENSSIGDVSEVLELIGPDAEIKGIRMDPREGNYLITYTCGVCETRQNRSFTKKSYHEGVVIVRCEGCQNLHLIADNLGFFEEEAGKIFFLIKSK